MTPATSKTVTMTAPVTIPAMSVSLRLLDDELDAARGAVVVAGAVVVGGEVAVDVVGVAVVVVVVMVVVVVIVVLTEAQRLLLAPLWNNSPLIPGPHVLLSDSTWFIPAL